jgi:hypothetical protein
MLFRRKVGVQNWFLSVYELLRQALEIQSGQVVRFENFLVETVGKETNEAYRTESRSLNVSAFAVVGSTRYKFSAQTAVLKHTELKSGWKSGCVWSTFTLEEIGGVPKRRIFAFTFTDGDKRTVLVREEADSQGVPPVDGHYRKGSHLGDRKIV